MCIELLLLSVNVNFVAFSMNRFQEVAAKLDVDLKEGCGFPDFELRGASDRGLPFMTAGLECYAYAGGPCGVEPGGHLHEDWAVIQAIDPRTGQEVPDGEWGERAAVVVERTDAAEASDALDALAAATDAAGLTPAGRPVRLELVDRLPLLASGKPDRRAIAAMVSGQGR